MANGTGRRILLVIGAAAVGSCAHAGPEAAPEADPVAGTIRQMTALTDAEGAVVCAADRVESDRTLQALLDSGPERVVTPSRRSSAYRLSRDQDMNLSQASEMMSQSYQRATDEARSMEPGAGQRSARAFAHFDLYEQIAANEGTTTLRRGEASPAEKSWAAAQYAAVWSEYYRAGDDDEGRDLSLDWLTTRSMAHPAVLAAYERDFDNALRHECR